MKKIFLCLLICGCSVDTDEIFGTFPGEFPDGGGGQGGENEGGKSNTGGNNSAGNNQGGSTENGSNSGPGGNNQCIPKTCDTIAFELSNGDQNSQACGNHSDGCGNQLNCNFSAQKQCELSWQKCNGENLVNPENSSESEPVAPGLCGGNCLIMLFDQTNACPGKTYVRCAYPTNELPQLGINESLCYTANGSNQSVDWCCPV